jgi:hypothetical protein
LQFNKAAGLNINTKRLYESLFELMIMKKT